MNLKNALKEEHSKQQTHKIIDWIGNSAIKFSDLMDIFFSEEQLLVQRSAWVVGLTASEHPDLFYPYFDKAVTKLGEKENHPAVTRNILRILQDIDIPEHLEGVLVELCLSFIVNPKVPGAIKAFAISTLENISKKYPELASEIILILKERTILEKPAFVSRAKRFCFAMEKIHKNGKS